MQVLMVGSQVGSQKSECNLFRRRRLPAFGLAILVMVASAAMGTSTAVAATTVTGVTGGNSISADTAGGTYTTLAGPVLSEGATGDIGNGTIILNAPAGFQFDTGGTVPTVLMTRIFGSGASNRNLNDVASGTSIAITSRTASQITLSITAKSSNGVRCSLTWQNVRVRPTAGTPLATGNITLSGTAVHVGLSNGASLGTLTEVAGAAAVLIFATQPASGVVGQTFSTQPVLLTRDQFGHASANGLPASRMVTVTLSSGSGTLQGTTMLDIGTAAGNGTVSFTNLRLDVVGSNKQLTASASALTSAVSSVFTVTPGNQTISFGALAGKNYGDAPFPLTATASSGLAITYNIQSGPATVLGSTVTLTGLGSVTVRAAQAGDANWNAATPVDQSFNVAPGTLTVSGITADNKVYDGNTTATLDTGSATLVGVVGDDVVTLDASGATAAFATDSVANGTTVTISGLALSGDDAANYTLTQPAAAANITPRGVTVTGITATSKIYDGLTSAALNTGSAALVNAIGGDDVTLDTSGATGAFANKQVANAKPVTISGLALDGDDAANYTLTQPAATADITPRNLAVSATGQNKAYDGTDAASVMLTDNRVGGDTLNTSYGTATFDDKQVGTGKSISVTGINVSGTDAGNYSANTTASAAADITALALSVTGITANNKVYDGNASATLDVGGANLVGAIGGDLVTLNTLGAAGAFANALAADGKPVTVSGLSLTGDDAANYTLSPLAVTADIVPRPITLAGTRAYDGTVEATSAILTVPNNLDGANLALTGSATLAGKQVGVQAASTRTVTRVQAATGNSGANQVTAFGVTLGAAPTTGHTLVAVIATRGSSANRVSSISQTGATWSRVSQAANGSGTTTEIWYAPNVAGAGTSITINQASLRSAAVVMEYSGVLSVGAPDQVASAIGNSATPTTGTTPTTSQGNELWIGSIGVVSSARTLGTPNNAFSTVTSAQSSHGTAVNNAKVFALEKIVSTTAAAASGGTLDAALPWSAAIATFRTTPLALTGSAAANYTLAGLSGSVTITTRNLTVTGIAANGKTYDGTTSATLNTGSAALVGVVSPDAVTLDTASAVGTFEDASIGAGKTVFVSGLALSGADAGNYNLTQPTTTASITAPVTTVQFGAPSTLWPETNSPLTILVTVSNPTASTVSVNYAVTGGTADNGGSHSDYALTDGTLSILPGVTTTTLLVNVVNDDRDEHDETIQLQLAAPVNASLGTHSTHTVTLVDEDPLPEIFFVGAPYTVHEAADDVAITVIISRMSDKDVRVFHSSYDGTAVAGSDFVAVTDNERWPPPSSGTTKNWNIPILDDGRAEGDQYFWVCLVDTQNCAIPVTSACAMVTIIDDDFAPIVTSGSGVAYPSPFEATLNGSLTSTGTAATSVGFYWGPSNGGTNPNLWAHSRALGGQNPGPFSTVISNLVAGQTYYYAAFATNAAGEAWSDVVPFIGRGNEAPVILDSSVTNAAVTPSGTNYTGPTPSLVAGLPWPTWSVDTATAALGVTINPSSGIVTWTNPVFATTPYQLTIIASNAFGTDSAAWLLRVVPEGDAVYVANTGSDTTGDGSPARPFATLTNAIAQRATITNIYVAAGTYPVASSTRLNSTAPLHISGGYSPDFFSRDPNAWATILDGNNASRTTPLFGSTGNCAGLVLQQFAGTAPIFAQVADFSLDQCLLRNNAMGLMGFAMQANGQLTFNRSRFFDNSYANGGNLVYGANTGWSLNMVNSLFANSTGGSRVCEAYGGMVTITAVNCTFYNSTLTDSGVSYWRPSGPSVVHTQMFINCLFWTANMGATPIKDSGNQGVVIIENCVFRTNGGQPWDAIEVEVEVADNLTGSPNVTFSSTSTSNPSAFKPNRESPTRNAGQSTVENALVPLTDILGEARLGATDIGAYEWITPDTTVFSFR